MSDNQFYVTADFLYWAAENQGFAYAYEAGVVDSTGFSSGEVLHLDSKWEPAFRVGAGWGSKYDFWDLFMGYTWYQNKASETSTNEAGYTQIWPNNSIGLPNFKQVSASSRFLMNMGDLELGRLVYITQSVALRPYLGLKGGAIHQKFKTFFSEPTDVGIENEHFTGHNNYWGIGPRTGLDGEWHLDKGFSILGRLAGALLYGKTEATTYVSFSSTSSREDRNDFNQLVPNLQMALGFQWQSCFWCETVFFRMSASWETNYWWNQFNLPESSVTVGGVGLGAPFGLGINGVKATTGNQPLTMEGLTMKFEFDF